ncbi:hypothetical protein SNEBB_010993 [Seison nebaliae]|nr:hypothetical protein SNEBB_010993 [Seison nebaliae]
MAIINLKERYRTTNNWITKTSSDGEGNDGTDSEIITTELYSKGKVSIDIEQNPIPKNRKINAFMSKEWNQLFDKVNLILEMQYQFQSDLRTLSSNYNELFQQTSSGNLKETEKNISISNGKLLKTLRSLKNQLSDIHDEKQKVEQIPDDDADKALIRAYAMQYTGLSDMMEELVEQFYVMQAKHKTKKDEFLVRTYKINNPTVSYEDSVDYVQKAIAEAIDQDGNESAAITRIIPQARVLTAINDERRKLTDVQERYSNFQKIEQGLVEVRDLFFQTEMMVKEQGDILTSISGTVLSAGDYVDKAKDEFKEAVKYQKSARRKKKLERRKNEK